MAWKPLTLIAVLLAVLLCFALSGCRDSDVLTEKIIELPGVAETDYSLPPVRIDNPMAQSGNEIDSYEDEEKETDERSDQEYDQPDFDSDEPTTDEETDSQVHSDSPKGSGKASSGGENNDEQGESVDGKEGGRLGVPDKKTDDPENEQSAPGGEPTEIPAEIPGDDTADPYDDEDGEEDEEPRKGTTVTIDIGDDDQSADPQPLDSPVADDPQGENDETWNPSDSNPNGGGVGDDDGDGKGVTLNDGTFDNVPKSHGGIAAAGPYATIVQSIGGAGALAACNQSWLDALPSQAYPGELDGVQGISSWGSGKAMSNATIQAIIDSGADVVLTSNTYGGVTTNAQAQALNDAGVSVVVMPDIGVYNALDADIVKAVQVVGEALSETDCSVNGKTPKQMAAAWKSLHDTTLERTMSANGGYTTYMAGSENYNFLYQGELGSAWNSRIANVSKNRVYYAYVDSWRIDVGTSVLRPSADGSRMMSAFRLQYASGRYPMAAWSIADEDSEKLGIDVAGGLGLSNPINATGGNTRSSFDLIAYYMQHAGLCDGKITGNASIFAGGNGNRGLIGTFVPDGTKAGALATSSFGLKAPLYIAHDADIAKKIKKSAETADKSSLTVGAYNLGGSYDIWVLPSGVDGSWNDGTAESFLIAPWAYSMAHERSATAAAPFVDSYYSTFYRCDSFASIDGKEVVRDIG